MDFFKSSKLTISALVVFGLLESTNILFGQALQIWIWGQFPPKYIPMITNVILFIGISFALVFLGINIHKFGNPRNKFKLFLENEIEKAKKFRKRYLVYEVDYSSKYEWYKKNYYAWADNVDDAIFRFFMISSPFLNSRSYWHKSKPDDPPANWARNLRSVKTLWDMDFKQLENYKNELRSQRLREEEQPHFFQDYDFKFEQFPK